MAGKTVCKDKPMALAIIGAISENMKAGTQRAALESVAEWLRGNPYGGVARHPRIFCFSLFLRKAPENALYPPTGRNKGIFQGHQ